MSWTYLIQKSSNPLHSIITLPLGKSQNICAFSAKRKSLFRLLLLLFESLLSDKLIIVFFIFLVITDNLRYCKWRWNQTNTSHEVVTLNHQRLFKGIEAYQHQNYEEGKWSPCHHVERCRITIHFFLTLFIKLVSFYILRPLYQQCKPFITQNMKRFSSSLNLPIVLISRSTLPSELLE